MYVVTGASGNTGAIVADELLSRGEKVRVVGRSAAKLERFTKRGAQAAIVDLADPDPAKLTEAFSGAKAVYAMIPPNLTSTDVLAYDGIVIKVIVTAIQRAAISHAVLLSSFGADKNGKTGPILGLHRFEEALNAVDDLNAVYLRAGYFMENTLAQVGVIKNFGMAGGPLRADLKIPMIATRDIGASAAERLVKLDFKGKSSQELLGQRDLTYTEVAKIIGAAIGNPSLAYMQLPNDQMKAAVMQMGFSENMADLLLEMCDSQNAGHVAALEKRGPANTTPTSFETFVKDAFVPAFEGRAAHA
jgi:uncharacterized protein YbjT (DUF2867 family)